MTGAPRRMSFVASRLPGRPRRADEASGGGGGVVHPFDNWNWPWSEQSSETGQLGDEPTSARERRFRRRTRRAPRRRVGPQEKPKGTGRRKTLLGAVGVLVLAGALWFGIPWVRMTLNTVSTDDAYVNGHVTFVAARVKGQVSRVLVDDNYRVRKGDLLVELDKEPFRSQSRSKRRP